MSQLTVLDEHDMERLNTLISVIKKGKIEKEDYHEIGILRDIRDVVISNMADEINKRVLNEIKRELRGFCNNIDLISDSIKKVLGEDM